MPKHTLSVLVENKPGVLARIAGLFSRRSFNIDSLAVGPTEHPDISRMTVVVDVDELPLEQVTKQLNKLVEVLKVVELEPQSSVQRQIVLVKVRADASNRSHIVETAELFRAKVVDVASDSLTIEATGKSEKLDALLTLLMALAAWATLTAIEKASWRWFLAVGLLIGFGFLGGISGVVLGTEQLNVLDDRDLGVETAQQGGFGYASRHLLVSLDHGADTAYQPASGSLSECQAV